MGDEDNRHAGKPGKPGERGTGQRGGAGGAGGVGGEGGFEGGVGGAGGTGGQTGPAGPRGIRGPSSRRALIGYFFLCIGVVFAFWLTHQQMQENEKAHVALCALQTDLEGRVARANTFLDDNPEGIPGISRQVILRGITAQKATIKTLQVLDC